eukprot:1108524_1
MRRISILFCCLFDVRTKYMFDRFICLLLIIKWSDMMCIHWMHEYDIAFEPQYLFHIGPLSNITYPDDIMQYIISFYHHPKCMCVRHAICSDHILFSNITCPDIQCIISFYHIIDTNQIVIHRPQSVPGLRNYVHWLRGENYTPS